MTKSLQTLPSIFSCGIISTENIGALTAINAELADAWGKRQVFRTETEMRVSVLQDGKFPTLASKYWQSVREQTVMLDNLAIMGFDYRRNELKIKKLNKQLLEAVEEFEIEELQIDLDECYFRKASSEQAANDRVREIKLWSQIKSELDDGTFDTRDVNTHQLASMTKALHRRKDCLTEGSSQAEVINVLGPLQTAERLANGS